VVSTVSSAYGPSMTSGSANRLITKDYKGHGQY